MVVLACLAFTANKLGNTFFPDSGDLVSAFGALIIGLLGNFYSRIVRGTAFTSMVTAVLFLVPVSRQMVQCLPLSVFPTVWHRAGWRTHRHCHELDGAVLIRLFSGSAHDPSCHRNNARSFRQPNVCLRHVATKKCSLLWVLSLRVPLSVLAVRSPKSSINNYNEVALRVRITVLCWKIWI